MIVLSLFDGMACGYEALKRAGIKVTKYYASEIDAHAIKIAKKNHPDIIHLGDVLDWKKWNIQKPDLIIGGSPCQGFSFSGKGLAFDDPRSKLFFVMNDIIKWFNPKYYLLENVKMKKEHLDVITDYMGVQPHFINSSLVSAQNRQRLYWYNWHCENPTDKGIVWGDIREHGVNTDSYYYTENGLNWLMNHSRRKNKLLKIHADDEKMQMLEASHCKGYSSQRFFGIIDYPNDEQCVASMRGRRIDPLSLTRSDYDENIPRIQYVEFRYDGKTNCLTTVAKDNIVVPFTLPNRISVDSFFFRYITPIECERLQTLPDNYTEGVSKTQRYKMLGNGWTVDVIKHLFEGLKDVRN
jgi:DNA-cytosine methyltransferase